VIWYARLIITAKGVHIGAKHRDPECCHLNRVSGKNEVEVVKLSRLSGIARYLPECNKCHETKPAAWLNGVGLEPHEALRRRRD